MMTKQAELKKQAYASTLKSRALSVLIYLIDRSNKELTCFPAIPTMAEQLHISISTVKRALHELLDAGYVKKDARFREKNKGQTSNLYTLVLFEEQPISDDSQDFDCDNHTEASGEVLQEKEGEVEQEVCQVEHISFDTLIGQKEEIPQNQMEELQENIEGIAPDENYQNIWQKNKVQVIHVSIHPIKQFFIIRNGGTDFSLVFQDRGKRIYIMLFGGLKKILLYMWTGEGVSLMPP